MSEFFFIFYIFISVSLFRLLLLKPCFTSRAHLTLVEFHCDTKSSGRSATPIPDSKFLTLGGRVRYQDHAGKIRCPPGCTTLHFGFGSHPSLSPPLPLFGVLDSICFNLGHYYRLLSLHLTLMPISVISVIKRLLCPSYSHELTILTILTAVARGEFIIIDARH